MNVLTLNFYHFLKSKVLVLFLFFNFMLYSQGSFSLPNGKNKDKVKFELANNLIIVPVMVNGVELSFILDTGVGATIIFSLEKRETLELKNASKILLRGLGDDEPVEAIKSVKNELRIGNSVSKDHTLYVIFDESINFSPRMGFPVHGIIGYDFLKNFVVDINYSKKFLKIHTARSYTYKKCKKCYQTDLNFIDGKRPYMDVKHLTDKGMVNLNMLIDSGSGSALWMFPNEDLGIYVPKNSFREYLGKGFSGDIYGNSSKINSLVIGTFEMKNVTTSFPDSIYVKGVSTTERQGSIGGSILRRFNLVMDYPNKKISFKKNGYFKRPFYYNMSGLTVQHGGVRVAAETGGGEVANSSLSVELNSNKKRIVSQKEYVVLYSLKPEFEIADVRPGSPADLVGLKKGDVILEVNGKAFYSYQLSDLNELFYSEEGKKIKMRIERLGVEMTFEFYLKKVI